MSEEYVPVKERMQSPFAAVPPSTSFPHWEPRVVLQPESLIKRDIEKQTDPTSLQVDGLTGNLGERSLNPTCGPPSTSLATYSSSYSVPANAWQLGGISWIFLLHNMPWVSIFITFIMSSVPCIIVHFHMGVQILTYQIYDTSLSYPRLPEYVPIVLGYVMPAILFTTSVVIGEFMLQRRKHGCLTNAISTSLLFVVHCTCSCSCTFLVVEVSKRTVGSLRPYFFAVCRPQLDGLPVHATYGSSMDAMPPCTNPNQTEINDARLSFPSGSSAVSATIALYTCVYCFWTLYCRQRKSLFHTARSWADVRVRNIFHILGFFWILVQFGMAWVIALCRIVDFRHRPVDVLAGIFLGSFTGIFWALYTCVSIRQRWSDAQLGMQSCNGAVIS
eukprot:jgi/Botrbrau1/20396/Bobra.0006s0057.2